VAAEEEGFSVLQHLPRLVFLDVVHDLAKQRTCGINVPSVVENPAVSFVSSSLSLSVASKRITTTRDSFHPKDGRKIVHALNIASSLVSLGTMLRIDVS